MITCLHQSSRAKSEPNHQSTWIRGREEKETTDLDEIFLAPPWTVWRACSTVAPREPEEKVHMSPIDWRYDGVMYVHPTTQGIIDPAHNFLPVSGSCSCGGIHGGHGRPCAHPAKDAAAPCAFRSPTSQPRTGERNGWVNDRYLIEPDTAMI
jgi:hypothetical protein